jgi:hypothetical protein
MLCGKWIPALLLLLALPLLKAELQVFLHELQPAVDNSSWQAKQRKVNDGTPKLAKLLQQQ